MRVTCDCGKKLRVDEALAGRHFKCPGCGQRITVPKRSESGSASASPVVSKGTRGVDRRHTGDRAQPPLPAANTRTPAPSFRWHVWLFGGGGWLLVGMLMVVFVWNRDSGSTVSQPPSQPAGANAAPAPSAVNSRTETVPAPSVDQDESVPQKAKIPVNLTNALGISLRLIPAGEFMMGSPDREVDRNDNEGPQHRVRITQPFYFGEFEVTQRQWRAVMGSNPSLVSSVGVKKSDLYPSLNSLDTSDFPVDNVSWYDCIEFCNKLSQRDAFAPYYTLTGIVREQGSIKSAHVSIAGGSGYRLPTEAEWEYACRAGTGTPFHFGTSSNGTRSNTNGDDPYGTSTKGPNLGRASSVGKYAANAFGLHDMHGNVNEWCFDRYDEAAYKSRSGTTSDPVVVFAPVDSPVLRGGDWGSSDDSRSAYRTWYPPDDRNFGRGFRVARTP